MIFSSSLIYYFLETKDIPDTIGPEELDYKPQNLEAFYDPYFKMGSL